MPKSRLLEFIGSLVVIVLLFVIALKFLGQALLDFVGSFILTTLTAVFLLILSAFLIWYFLFKDNRDRRD